MEHMGMSIHTVHIRHGWVNDRPRLDLIHLIHWIRGFRRFQNRRPGSDMSFCASLFPSFWIVMDRPLFLVGEQWENDGNGLKPSVESHVYTYIYLCII